MKHILSIFMIVSVAFVLTGCNTMEGMGKDIEAGGEALEEAADDAN